MMDEPLDMERKMKWRHEIKHGPDGEDNYAWVYDDKGNMVCTTKTYHAIAIVSRMNDQPVKTRCSEGLTGREQSPWLCHVTPAEVYTTSDRILDLIQEADPVGDRITQHELRIFSHAFADLGRSQALFRFQHGLDQDTPALTSKEG